MNDCIAKLESENKDQMNIDECFGPIEPLYKQLFNAYVEESAIVDTIYYLNEGLKKEVIDLDIFLKVSNCWCLLIVLSNLRTIPSHSACSRTFSSPIHVASSDQTMPSKGWFAIVRTTWNWDNTVHWNITLSRKHLILYMLMDLITKHEYIFHENVRTFRFYLIVVTLCFKESRLFSFLCLAILFLLLYQLFAHLLVLLLLLSFDVFIGFVAQSVGIVLVGNP